MKSFQKTINGQKYKGKVFEESDVINKFNRSKDEWELIDKYQKTFPQLLIDDVEGFVIDARTLWEELGQPQGAFNKFIKRKVIDVFVLNEDYKLNSENSKQERSVGGTFLGVEYKLKLETAIYLCMNTKGERKKDVLKKLLKTSNSSENIICIEPKRLELSFLDMLEDVLKPMNIKGVRQYSLFGGKYRIDYYIPELKLAIEYDEQQHFKKDNVTKDEIRQSEIEKELGCMFIRCDYRNTNAYNIGLVMNEIIKIK